MYIKKLKQSGFAGVRIEKTCKGSNMHQESYISELKYKSDAAEYLNHEPLTDKLAWALTLRQELAVLQQNWLR